MTILLDIDLSNISPIIPTTILGLIGAAFFYLYGSYKTKKDNELKEIQSIQSDEAKNIAIEMRLNEFGTRIPTEGLTPTQKYDLLLRLIRAKTLRYLITAIAAIIFAVIIAAILLLNKDDKKVKLSDLSLQSYFLKKDNSLSPLLTYDELCNIVEVKSRIVPDGNILSLEFHFDKSQMEQYSNFQFNFNEPFSKRLGGDRANPLGWSSTAIGGGKYSYTATDFKETTLFEMSYSN